MADTTTHHTILATVLNCKSEYTRGQEEENLKVSGHIAREEEQNEMWHNPHMKNDLKQDAVNV